MPLEHEATIAGQVLESRLGQPRWRWPAIAAAGRSQEGRDDDLFVDGRSASPEGTASAHKIVNELDSQVAGRAQPAIPVERSLVTPSKLESIRRTGTTRGDSLTMRTNAMHPRPAPVASQEAA